MAKKQIISEYEKVMSSLTGGFRTDKELIINAINSLRYKGDYNVDISKLGQHLYKILLDNGLNESDIINFERLTNKIDVYLYEKQYQQAIEIIEVLDSQLFFLQKDGNNEKIYFLRNPIELAILSLEILKKDQNEINFFISQHSQLLVLKAHLYFLQKNYKEAEILLNQILSMNPVCFEAYLELANVYFENKSKNKFDKIRKYLEDAYNVCYQPQNLVDYLLVMSKLYEEKKDYLTAYACLTCVGLFENPLAIQSNFNHLKIEINKSQTTNFNGLTMDEAKRILNREKIPYLIKDNIISIVLEAYKTILVYDFNNIPLINMCKEIIENLVVKSPDVLKEIENIAKKERDSLKN